MEFSLVYSYLSPHMFPLLSVNVDSVKGTLYYVEPQHDLVDNDEMIL
jgi:hypothetical protein